MAENQWKPFIRCFSRQDALKATSLWTKLKPDITACEVFPAIRNEEAHFYHRGGRLLAFDSAGYRTNVKYALALHDGRSLAGDIGESQLDSIDRIRSFDAGYEGMKELCALYAGGEAAAVAELYARWPYTRCLAEQPQSVVVLDIEASLSADVRKAEPDKQDRIDLVLLDTRDNELLLVEVKLFSNGAIRAQAGNPPKVVTQIGAYREQLAQRAGEIITQYGRYTEAVNNLFGLHIQPPTKILGEVPLLIVDFDADQQDGRLTQNIDCLQSMYNVCCLSIGKTGRASDGTLTSWFQQVKNYITQKRQCISQQPAIP